jgi:hypothetical protein
MSRKFLPSECLYLKVCSRKFSQQKQKPKKKKKNLTDSFWTYCLALATFCLDDIGAAAALCREGLTLSPGDKERVQLEGLLLRCEIFDSTSSPSIQQRPAVVPMLQLNSISAPKAKPKSRRSKTDREKGGRVRKSKAGSAIVATEQQQQQQQQAEAVIVEKTEQPTARELELMAEVASLKEQLQAAKAQIEELNKKLEEENDKLYYH